jgi:hypothetical protein
MSIFYYQPSDPTITDGTESGGTFTSSDSITNEERLMDDSIAISPTNIDGSDMAMFDFGSAKTMDFVALYFTAEETDNVTIYYSDDGSAVTSHAVYITTFSTGWTIIDLTEESHRYWAIKFATAGSFDGLAEVIIGNKYDFDVNPDLNASTGAEFGTEVLTSLGGVEYANKRHAPKANWSWNWSSISVAMKTSLETMRDTVQDFKKFVYYDGTNYHYVRLTGGLDFQEIAYQRYSTSIQLREQIS